MIRNFTAEYDLTQIISYCDQYNDHRQDSRSMYTHIHTYIYRMVFPLMHISYLKDVVIAPVEFRSMGYIT